MTNPSTGGAGRSAAAWPKDGDVIAAAARLIKAFEGFSATPYLCPAGKWTIGYGSRFYPDGTAVSAGDPAITEVGAGKYLSVTMHKVLFGLKKLMTRTPTVSQEAAILSLTYNVGLGVHDGKKGDIADSDLLAAFNRGDDARVAAEFPLWNKAHVNGVLTVVPGLTRRRAAELDLYLKS